MNRIHEELNEAEALRLIGTIVILFELQGFLFRPLLPGETNFNHQYDA